VADGEGFRVRLQIKSKTQKPTQTLSTSSPLSFGEGLGVRFVNPKTFTKFKKN
jgi:hypothetical protein